jgi:transposase
MTKSIEIKLAAIRSYNIFKSLRQVSNIFSVSHSSVARWLKIQFFSKISKPSKMTREMVNFLKYSTKNNPFQTCSDLKNQLFTIFNIKVSSSLCYSALKKANISKVKVKTHYRSKLQTEKLCEFKNQIQLEIDSGRKLIFIDETGFRTNSFPLYGYVSKGSKLVKYIGTSCHRKVYSTCVATSEDSILHVLHKNSAFNTESFLHFLDGIMIDSNCTLVMDNASIHKTKLTLNFIKSKGWKVCFLPPGTPDFNPVENLFGIVKTYYRKLCSNVDSFSKNVNWLDLIQASFSQIKSTFLPSLYLRSKNLWSLNY